MSDHLRDRIAAVLDKHRPMFNVFDGEPSDWCECGMPISHVADAVIREVLTPEFLADLMIAAVQKAADNE